MENYFDKMPGEYKSAKSIIIPLLLIGLSLLGLISMVSLISENFDIRNQAAMREQNNEYKGDKITESSFPRQFPCTFTRECPVEDSSCVQISAIEGFCSSSNTGINFTP